MPPLPLNTMPSGSPNPVFTDHSSNSPSSDDDTLLQDCLDAVLPTCNSRNMKELLKAYYESKENKKSRYPPFTNAFNYALEELRKIQIPQLRSPSDLEILFRVNDPKTISGNHGTGVSSLRSPDINIVSLEAARRSASKNPGSKWADFTYSTSLKQPDIQFSWPNVFASLEFKKTDETLPLPPQIYDSSSLGHIPPKAPDPSPVRNSIHAQNSISTRDFISVRDSTLDPVSAIPTSNVGSNQMVREAMVQSATYATEMLCSSIGRCHAIVVVIIDEIARIWWFDRQGAIQSTGINIVKNLPHFLVLLLAFQRFTLADWGFDTALDPNIESNHKGQKMPKGDTCTIKMSRGVEAVIDTKHPLSQRYSLTGRCSRVLPAESPSLHPDSNQNLVGMKLVAKISWPNESRVSKARIIKCAVDKLGNPDHLPYLIDSLDGYRTATIREELGIRRERSNRPCRVLRIMLFEHLEPITKLEGKAFVKAWLQCIRCHYALWKGGIQHRDLSFSNLMLRTRDGVHFGVINDWDLSIIEDESKELGERTATIPFLAMDLLKDAYWAGEIEVLYRHELESFIWIIVWVLFCYNHDAVAVPSNLQQWQTADFRECFEHKLAFLEDYWDHHVTPAWTTEEPIVHNLLGWLGDKRSDRRKAKGKLVEPSEASVLCDFVGKLVTTSEVPGLEYLLEPARELLV